MEFPPLPCTAYLLYLALLLSRALFFCWVCLLCFVSLAEIAILLLFFALFALVDDDDSSSAAFLRGNGGGTTYEARLGEASKLPYLYLT